MTTTSLRLKWAESWPDRENDFCGKHRDTGERVGRIYAFRDGFNQQRWRWAIQSFSALGSGGLADSPREAAEATERDYFAALERRKARSA